MGIFSGIMLVSDMDGTIINKEKKISEKDREAIEYFKENGGLFTVATGRMLPSASRYAIDLKLSLPVILYNGCKIYDYETESVLNEYTLEDERKEIIRKLMEVEGIGLEVYSEENIYVFKECHLTKRFSKLGYNVIFGSEGEIWNKKWTKILIVGEGDILDKFEEDFSMYDVEKPLRSAIKYLEIVPNSASKGQALKELIELKKLQDYKVVAVGDNMNDEALLEAANYGFAVKNANPRLLEKAKYIAPSNNENPLAYIVNWIEKELIEK
ncbi:MAG: Cof-type HAD-IIB family hydrolase [Clostridium sp.]